MVAGLVRSSVVVITKAACRKENSNPKVVNGNIGLQRILDDDSEPINYFTLFQRFSFIREVFERAHHPYMCPSISVFWVPQHVSDDYIHDRGIDEEPLGELPGTKIMVHALFHRTTLLEEILLLLVTRLLVFLPSLRMLLLVMLYVLSF